MSGHFQAWLKSGKRVHYSKPIYKSEANDPQDPKITTGYF